jgi:hypothetical protein
MVAEEWGGRTLKAKFVGAEKDAAAKGGCDKGCGDVEVCKGRTVPLFVTVGGSMARSPGQLAMDDAACDAVFKEPFVNGGLLILGGLGGRY